MLFVNVGTIIYLHYVQSLCAGRTQYKIN